MIALKFHLAARRFAVWLNTGDNALHLTAAWTLPTLALIIIAIEVFHL